MGGDEWVRLVRTEGLSSRPIQSFSQQRHLGELVKVQTCEAHRRLVEPPKGFGTPVFLFLFVWLMGWIFVCKLIRWCLLIAAKVGNDWSTFSVYWS